jgi:predicted SAM-dependent methyltransferase
MNIVGSEKETGLNVGCGGETRFNDTETLHWINIDARPNVGADVVIDILKGLPYENNTISKIVSVHMIEHMPRLMAPKVAVEFFRVLKSGGTCDVEVPNFDLTVKEYLDGNDAVKKIRIENIYGRQFFDGDQHCWGYNFTRLKELLTTAGFIDIVEIPEHSYHKRFEPCLRVIGKKP